MFNINIQKIMKVIFYVLKMCKYVLLLHCINHVLMHLHFVYFKF